ncbi:hypothetical protein HNP84_009773 [Thermocatellispora tengchongensis]|uniref:Uncharacterized protein n=1 Tax=Thermocatellispora tengchongensis TaxID=1073253 RepID=A0A840PKF8_9ACTN|nr:hypothetical protein [Thermocatellispora tengchongensis]MBB5140008.1 hypothetical protein [Thermocatellispora tengchongensis]
MSHHDPTGVVAAGQLEAELRNLSEPSCLVLYGPHSQRFYGFPLWDTGGWMYMAADNESDLNAAMHAARPRRDGR